MGITPTGGGALAVNQAAARDRARARRGTATGGSTRTNPLASLETFAMLQRQQRLHRDLAVAKLEGRSLGGGLYLDRRDIDEFEPTATGSALIDELLRRGHRDIAFGPGGQLLARDALAPATQTFGADGEPMVSEAPGFPTLGKVALGVLVALTLAKVLS